MVNILIKNENSANKFTNSPNSTQIITTYIPVEDLVIVTYSKVRCRVGGRKKNP